MALLQSLWAGCFPPSSAFHTMSVDLVPLNEKTKNNPPETKQNKTKKALFQGPLGAEVSHPNIRQASDIPKLISMTLAVPISY